MTYAETYLGTLQNHARSLSEKPCYIDKTGSWTYSELWTLINACAQHLSISGIGRNDHVILDASNVREFIYIYPALHLVGASVTPIDPNTPDSKVATLLQRFADAGQSVHYIPANESNSSSAQLDSPFHTRQLISVAELKVKTETMDLAAVQDVEYSLPAPDDISDILFTSGATGTPKGVLLTHKNHIKAVDHINQFGRISKDDVELLSMPLCHSFGLARMRCVLAAGATLTIIDGVARLKPFFKAITDYGVTGIGLVPSAWALLRRATLDKMGQFSNQIRYMEFGSAYMPLDTKLEFQKLLPQTHVFMHYGLTECSRAAFLSFQEDNTKLNSVGQAGPLAEVAIFDAHGNELEANQGGEICVRGDMQMAGYWNDQVSTDEAMFDDWVRTGDLGFMDDSGYIYLKGRAKELINVGGRKVSPVEVDDQVNILPGILECACVGVSDPDNMTGEAIIACIVEKFDGSILSDQDMLNRLRLNLEFYKLPKQFLRVTSIPKTPTGKIQRLQLAQKIAPQLNNEADT